MKCVWTSFKFSKLSWLKLPTSVSFSPLLNGRARHRRARALLNYCTRKIAIGRLCVSIDNAKPEAASLLLKRVTKMFCICHFLLFFVFCAKQRQLQFLILSVSSNSQCFICYFIFFFNQFVLLYRNFECFHIDKSNKNYWVTGNCYSKNKTSFFSNIKY